MKKIPSIVVPIVDNIKSYNVDLFKFLTNKKVVIFGVPGAFTPTCSEQHLPGFLRLSDKIKCKGIDDIFCLSVNDKFVMSSWLSSYSDGSKIKGIADGNAEITKFLKVISDKSLSFMGLRSSRFAMIVDDCLIIKNFLEESGKFEVSSAENILSNL